MTWNGYCPGWVGRTPYKQSVPTNYEHITSGWAYNDINKSLNLILKLRLIRLGG